MNDRPAIDRLRVYVAGAPDAPITHAAIVALARHPLVDLVGLDLDRLDPARLREAAPDLLLSAAHRYLIQPPELAVARFGSVGLHPGLLPRYRGSHPLWWALRNEEQEAGISLYVLDSGIDTGPILAQETVPIEEGDTFASLYARTVEHVGPLLDGLVETIAATGRMPDGQVQDESKATLFRAPTEREMSGTLMSRVKGRAQRGAHVAAGVVATILHAIERHGGDRV